jgi:hypothetical protein
MLQMLWCSSYHIYFIGTHTQSVFIIGYFNIFITSLIFNQEAFNIFLRVVPVEICQTGPTERVWHKSNKLELFSRDALFESHPRRKIF